MNDTNYFSFNGINGATGDSLLPAMSATELPMIAQSEILDKGLIPGKATSLYRAQPIKIKGD